MRVTAMRGDVAGAVHGHGFGDAATTAIATECEGRCHARRDVEGSGHGESARTAATAYALCGQSRGSITEGQKIEAGTGDFDSVAITATRSGSTDCEGTGQAGPTA